MFIEEDDNEKNLNDNNTEDIEVVLGDNSILEISAVGDMMNDLRPKDSVNNRKKVIIPQVKKNVVPKENKKSEDDEEKKSDDNSDENNDNNDKKDNE